MPLPALAAPPAGTSAASDPAFWLVTAVAMLLLAGLSFTAGMLLARQRATSALNDARGRLRALSQMLEAWQWQTDESHRLVALEAPLGTRTVAPDGWQGRALWERFEPCDRAGADTLRAHLDRQAPVADLQVNPDGSRDGTRWRLRAAPRFDSAGRFCGYLGTARPEAPRPQTMDPALLESLLAASAAAICIGGRDGPNSTWLLKHASPAALRVLNLGAASLGMPWQRIFDSVPETLRVAALALQPGEMAEVDGCVLRLEAFGRNGESDGGRMLVLEPQAAAVPDAPSSEQAAFSYTVSHDLRAPIRVVEGFTRILKEDYGRLLDRIGNDHLDRVLTAAARMNSMIDALLALAQLSTQPLSRQPVNLSQLAGYVVDDLRRMAPERQVDAQVEPALLVHGDPTLLRLVLENLLGNAWKYTSRCAHATIGLRSQLQGGRRVYVVHDNGAGFDMRSAERLFGVFQRLHSSKDFPGTGVGLASVKRIVRRHGGDIWAESEPGQGARFHFTLAD